MPNEETAKKKDKRIIRSPKYPSLNVEMAIEKARAVYEKEKKNSVSVRVVMQDMGYGTNPGDGGRALAALLGYGLLESIGVGEKKQVRLSDIATRIILDTREVSEERNKLIQEIALRPDIHKKLWGKYGNEHPSDEQMEYDLKVEMNFNPDVVKSVIKEYKETLAFAKLSGTTKVEQIDNGAKRDKSEKEKERKERKMQGQMREYTIPASGQSEIVLQVPSTLTEKDFDRLTKWLELMKEPLTSTEPENNVSEAVQNDRKD
ncbi:MAG: hypothetical protein HZB51_28675 [Chloroflexi bacterium]|nr:hypothetical protein [Chloroflexota bacterium]